MGSLIDTHVRSIFRFLLVWMFFRTKEKVDKTDAENMYVLITYLPFTSNLRLARIDSLPVVCPRRLSRFCP